MSANMNSRVDLTSDGSRRLVATQDIPAGHMVLHDTAFLLTWDSDLTYHYQSWCLVHRLVESYPKKSLKEIREEFSDFSSAFAKPFDNARFVEDSLRCLGIFKPRFGEDCLAGLLELWALVATNNLHWFGGSSEHVPRGGAGLFRVACFVNHSCDHNVEVTYKCTRTSARIMLHSNQPIKMGEEITMEYARIQPDKPNHALPVAFRQAYLKRFYSFDCACALCTLQL